MQDVSTRFRIGLEDHVHDWGRCRGLANQACLEVGDEAPANHGPTRFSEKHVPYDKDIIQPAPGVASIISAKDRRSQGPASSLAHTCAFMIQQFKACAHWEIGRQCCRPRFIARWAWHDHPVSVQPRPTYFMCNVRRHCLSCDLSIQPDLQHAM